jgi:hypothetical protein
MLLNTSRNRKDNLRFKYNLELDEFERMLRAQENRCYICKFEFNQWLRHEIDHDHYTGEVRKILCQSCNQRVSSVERGCKPSRHIARRFDRRPYQRYLEEHRDG